MAQMNQKNRAASAVTHEGGRAQAGSYEQQLRRAVTSCLLWEDSFYESGVSIAERIHELANKCDAAFVMQLALDVRKQHGIRHAPLWLILSILPRKDVPGIAKAKAVEELISRADELAEIIAMQWGGAKEGKLPNALKAGVAGAFHKFDEYQFGKYKGKGKAVTLRDALCLVHPKPKDDEQSALFKSIIDDTIKIPDTWETQLSGGADKKEVFTRLLTERKLGYLACLRNIRNMVEAGVSNELIVERLENPAGRKGVLPFQFMSASLMVPGFESVLDGAMIAVLEDMEMLPGSTAIMVDNSGSMYSTVSGRSKIEAVDAGCGMAIMLRELCEDVTAFSWASQVAEIAPRRGMALRDAVKHARVGHGTYGDQAVAAVVNDRQRKGKEPYDRLVVVTDMQFHDSLGAYPEVKHKYVVNVRPYQNGVGYGNWKWVDGFSAQTVRYMREIEAVE